MLQETDTYRRVFSAGYSLRHSAYPALYASQIGAVRLDALRYFDCLRACRVEIRPMPRAHAGHQRAAERPAFFGREHFHRLPINASLNLAPQRTARASAA